jgi:hypothetical protein
MQFCPARMRPIKAETDCFRISFSIGEGKISRPGQLIRGYVRGEDCGLSVFVLRSEDKLRTLPVTAEAAGSSPQPNHFA